MFNTALKTELSARTAEVTEYKGLIAALERSMAVVEFDLNGKVLRANDNFLKTLGYSAGQLAGKTHRDFCLPALTSSSAYSQFWSDLKAGKFVSGTFWTAAATPSGWRPVTTRCWMSAARCSKWSSTRWT